MMTDEYLQHELLIFGYIRSSKLNVPDAVRSLCHQFYPYYEYVQFSIFNPTTSQLLEDYTYLRSLHAENQTFVGAQGYKTSGYYQWKIKIVKLEGYNAGIGVAMIGEGASFDFVTQKNCWMSDPQFSGAYYWWSSRHRSTIYKYEKGVRPDLVTANRHCFLTGDIVIVCLDCNQWKLSFKLISKSDGPEIAVQEVEIIPTGLGQVYHPAISLSNKGEEFKLLLS